MHPVIRVVILSAALMTGLVLAAQSQAPLTNADVVAMVKAGITEQIIVTAIQTTQDRKFDLSASALIALKTAGVSDAVISAMQAAGAAHANAPAAAPGNAPAATRAVAPVAAPAMAPRASSQLAPPEPISNEDSDHFFKIDNVSGKLTPLERPKLGQYTNSLQVTERMWLKDATSPMAISADDQPLRFAVRFGVVTKAWDKQMADYQKKPLVIQEMKVQKDTRQQTKTMIPLQMTPVDSPSHEYITRRKQDATFQTFVLTVPGRLAPGEYVIQNQCCGVLSLGFGEAFKIER